MSQQTLLKVLGALLCISLAACSGTGKNRKAVYEDAASLPPLEVPPDLTAPVAGGAMSVPELQYGGAEGQETGGPSVLPQVRNVRLGRDGAARWLIVDASPEQLWPRLRQFWDDVGLEIAQEEPQLGIIETQWAENRAEVPNNFLSRLLPKLYSSPKQDKFRMRLERGEGEGETTEIFLTHYGIEEVVAEKDDIRTVTRWETRPSDVALVNEILQRLMLYLGVPEGQAQGILAAADTPLDRATLESGTTLIVHEQFPRAWRRTGIALDRIGFVVEDRNRSQGVYFVKETNAAREGRDGKGWLSGLFSDGPARTEGTRYLIAVQDQGQSSRVTVQDENGAQLESGDAKEILRRLYEELK